MNKIEYKEKIDNFFKEAKEIFEKYNIKEEITVDRYNSLEYIRIKEDFKRNPNVDSNDIIDNLEEEDKEKYLKFKKFLKENKEEIDKKYSLRGIFDFIPFQKYVDPRDGISSLDDLINSLKQGKGNENIEEEFVEKINEVYLDLKYIYNTHYPQKVEDSGPYHRDYYTLDYSEILYSDFYERNKDRLPEFK